MRIALALTLSCLMGVGLATTPNLKRSSIPARTMVKVMPREVTLEFAQPISTDSSRFKVYRLNLSANELETLEFGAMERLARAQTPGRLRLLADAPNRADAGLRPGTANVTKRVQLQLKPSLGPGAYALMWQTVTKTQPETGSFVFLNLPKCAALEPELKPEVARRPSIRDPQAASISKPRPQVLPAPKTDIKSPLFRVASKPVKPRDQSPLFRDVKPQTETSPSSLRKAKRCQ
jgi:methionine-rich copper-binding protein CopC